MCKKMCCQRCVVPLKLAFAKTVHSFQGQSVGPVNPGQPPNAYEAIICDPGTEAFEGNNPGLFYVIIGRGTTMGTAKLTDSAVFFCGPNMTKKRIRTPRIASNGDTYYKVGMRDRWTALLDRNTHGCDATSEMRDDLISWTKTEKYTINQLDDITERYVQSKNKVDIP